ncbi:MAG TPA: 4-hydroxyphenylpyruvate dioxygenase, partial [Alphaproteobacteria bacterium]|nr:4-hydroxyphenylpyruvate dioxygenase [Alphaproteobacteria bacterium]
PGSTVLADETAMAAMLAAVPEPRLGLALNAAHVLHDGAQPARLRGLPGERIHHVQLVDAAGDSTQRPADLLPGQGDLNLAALVRLLARSGYSGPWCLTRNTGPDAVPSASTSRPQPQSAARDGYRALVALLDDVARTAPDFARPQPMLPDRVYPKGLEFIEFATDEAGREPLVQQLEALCFRLERRHVSKAVELWRQGGVNIVVNTEPAQRTPSDAHKSHPRVSEIGLRVSDSRQTVKRAAMLGAPVHESIVAEGELELPAVKGVGGSIVHFIDEQSDLHRVWDIEFNPVTKTRATQPCGLRRIDHVSQTMPLDEMQSWLTYYTSTFEMEKTALTGVADPSGPILSQALSSPAGEVRLNLNGAAAQRTFADSFLEQGMTAGVQHIAFATDDIFETAERLQQTGLERLRIDGGYYTALQQHFGLDSAALARLQHHSILYDRHGEGEYFQLYCRPIFNGFFFEIVERRGGYPGYGARNASVRLAAQVEQQSHTTGQRGQATP